MQLPADDPEAIAFSRKSVPEQPLGDTPEASASTGVDAISASTEPTAGPSKPKAKGPVRRKPRQSLEAMSAALDKGKKMTTLEKVCFVSQVYVRQD